jgi:hypothetical protein
MKFVIAVIVITAIVFYVWYDFDRIKVWIGLDKKDKAEEQVAETTPPPVVEEAPKIVSRPKQPGNKFNEGDKVYINAMAGDQLGFQSNQVELWITYEGSEHEDSQRVVKSIEHRTKCVVVSSAVGANKEIWYKIRTLSNFQSTGWVKEAFLSVELPKRRDGKNAGYD